MTLLRRVREWLQRPTTATRIRALEEQTRLSMERTAQIRATTNPIEADVFPRKRRPGGGTA